MVGQPFLESLLEWCEGDDVADAVEKAREAMRASLAGANGDAGVATGGHLSRTFSKLELEAKAARADAIVVLISTFGNGGAYFAVQSLCA